MKRVTRSFTRSLLLTTVLALQLPGCAVIDRDHRHLTKIVERCVPENMALSLLTFPVWGTAGIVTLAVDGLVVNPVLNAPAALGDAGWAFTGFGLILPLEIVLLPVRTVATVPIFLGSEIVRCMVPFVF